MPIPQISPEKHEEALIKAAEARIARTALRNKIKTGEIKITDALLCVDDPVISKIKVSLLLESLPGYGKIKVAKLMDRYDIDKSRRVKGLGKNQRQALIDHFSK